MLTKVPQFVFEGALDPQRIEGVYRYIRENPSVPTRNASNSMKRDITHITATVVEHFRSIGLDVSDRIATQDKICCMEEDDFIRFRTLCGYDSGTYAFRDGETFKIFYTLTIEGKRKQRYAFARTILHELIHSCSYIKIGLPEDRPTFGVSKSAFYEYPGYHYFLESVIDMTVCEIIKSRWKKDKLLQAIEKKSYEYIHYWRGIILLDAAIKLVSRHTKKSFKSILHSLQRDLVMGTSEGLDLLRSWLPKEGFDDFFYLEDRCDDEMFKKTAIAIGHSPLVAAVSDMADFSEQYIYLELL